jgi:amino acid transporter
VSYISNYFGSLSLVTGNAAYGSTAANIVQPIPTLAIATILNVIITIITLVGLRFSKRALIGIQAIAWLSLFVALGIIAANGPASFGSAWNHYLGSQLNYSNATAVAQAKGLTYQSGISPIFVATFWAFFSILGYQSVGYLGGEVKKSSTTIIRSMVTALLISVAILGLGTYIIENTIGYSFLASSTFLSATGQLSVAPYFALIASVLAPNVGIISFIYLGLSLWLVVLLMGLFLLLTRTIFAWSFDGVVPFVFSNVSRRFASPIWSCVLIGVLMELGIIIGIFSVLGSFLNLSVVFLLTYSVNTLTSALLPVLKPDWFNNAPSIARYRIGGKLPLISLMGGITTLFFWFLIYEIFLNPSIAGAINAYSASAIVIVAAAGAAIYFGARSYRKSRGMDLSAVFGEIPPD